MLLPGEDAAPYEAFRAKLLAELAAVGTVEEMLAQSVCAIQWRLERARKLEANVLALPHYEDLPAGIDTIADSAERAAVIEAYAAVKYEKALRNIHIQEARLGRSLSKTLDDLRKEQAERRRGESARMTAAINARTFHKANEETFRPEQLGFVFTTAEIDKEIKRRYTQSTRLRHMDIQKSPPGRKGTKCAPGRGLHLANRNCRKHL